MSASARAACRPVARRGMHLSRDDAAHAPRRAWVAPRRAVVARAANPRCPSGRRADDRARGRRRALGAIPATPGVYAIYDETEAASTSACPARCPRRSSCASSSCQAVRVRAVRVLPDADKSDLQAAWKAWMTQQLAATEGALPPGNTSGNALWTARKNRASKPNLRLTKGDGDGASDEDVSKLCGEAVRNHRVVAFIKGTRAEPECGFSHRMCAMLDELLVDYETIDTLDEANNGNLRNVLKTLSDWPTIPQLYLDGELVGGHDILEEMHAQGELKEMLVPRRSRDTRFAPWTTYQAGDALVAIDESAIEPRRLPNCTTSCVSGFALFRIAPRDAPAARGARRHAAARDVESSATLGAARLRLGVPRGRAHLVLERRDVADDDPNVAGAFCACARRRPSHRRSGRRGARWCARRRLEPRSNAPTDASYGPRTPVSRTRAPRGPLVGVRAPRDAPSSRRQVRGPGAFAPWTARSSAPSRKRGAGAAARKARASGSTRPPRSRARAGRAPSRPGPRRRRGTSGAAADARGLVFRGDQAQGGFALPGDPESTSRFAMHQALRVRSGEVRARARTTRWTCSRGATIRAGRGRRRRIDDAPRARVRARRRAAEQPPRPRRGFRGRGTRRGCVRRELDFDLDAFVSRRGWTATGPGGDWRRGASVGPRERRARGVGRPRRAPARAAPGRDRRGARPRCTNRCVCQTKARRQMSCQTTRIWKEKAFATAALRDFVVAAVAKDCSVLVAFRGERKATTTLSTTTDVPAAAAAEGGPCHAFGTGAASPW